MKTLVFLFITTSSVAFAELCKKGDLENCITYLKSKETSEDKIQFVTDFDNICTENKNFKCTKIVVRGSLEAEIIELAKEYPAAVLFKVKTADEDFVYAIQKSNDSKKNKKNKKVRQSQLRNDF